MLCFPELTTHALAQYPVTKRLLFPYLETETVGAVRAVMAFPERAFIEWELPLSGLTAAEANSLKTFFDQVKGRQECFLFLDPLGNLLLWSEDFRARCWQLGSGLLIEPLESPDSPYRGHRVTNISAATQTVAQAVPAPTTYTYCFSLLASAQQPCSFSLSLWGGDTQVAREFQATASRRRFWVAGKISSSASAITASLNLPAGSSLDVWELQLEAQPAPSPYRRSSSTASVYPNARLSDDEIHIIANAPNSFSTTLRVRAPLD